MGGEDASKTVTQFESQGSKSTAPWENSNHPLYLHPSDQPGAVLAETLVEDNYMTWENSMQMALMIKNKLGFIDGSQEKPTHNPPEQLQWERCNILVKSWLIAAMSKEISKSVIHCKSAKAIWEELKERFAQVNTVSLYELESAIYNCEQGTSSVTTFFTRLKGLWDQKEALCRLPICTCDANEAVKAYVDTQKTLKFLMGLNDNFTQTRSNIIGMEPFPNLNKAYCLVLRHEKQLEVSSARPAAVTESAAFAVKKSGGEGNQATREGIRARRWCEKCKVDNHDTQYCRAHITCTFCEGTGHSYNFCRRRKRLMGENSNNGKREGQNSRSRANFVGEGKGGDMANFPLSQGECQQMMGLFNKIKNGADNSNEGRQLLEMLNSSTPSTTNLVGNVPNYEEMSGTICALSQKDTQVVWIFDSGASDHVVCNFDLLTHAKAVHNRSVRLPNNTRLQVSHIGTVCFSPSFTLHNVLCVPLFYLNLISVSKLVLDSFYVTIFIRRVCFVHDLR